MASDAVADVRDRTDIVNLVSDYVQLKKAGRNFKGLCPFHTEKTPSFIVFPDSGNFKCFGCGKGGDVFTFYKEVERVDFREALEELARRAGIELKSAPKPSPERDAHRQKLTELNELAATFYATQLRSAAAGERGRRTVEQRGLSAEVVEAFQIGVAPEGWDTLAQFFAARGVDPDRAVDAGLLTRRETGGYYDRFRNRLMFPIRDRDGNVVGFGGRAFGDEQPKYLNTPQTELFDKSHLLYGLDLARDEIRRQDKAVVVEGYMDVIAAHQFGYRNVVASMGTAITESQLGLLKRFSKNVVLALDADAAGQAAMTRALDALPDGESDAHPVPSPRGLIHYEKRLSVNINVLALPSGKDPDEMIRADPDQWPSVVNEARPFLAFYIDRIAEGVDLTDIREKTAAVHRAAVLLSLVPDGVEQRHYVEVLANRLRMSERKSIEEAIRQARKQNSISAPPLPSPPVPRKSSVEDHLAALILAYPAILADFAAELNPNELTDARNRELVIQVAASHGEPTADPADHLQTHRDYLASLLSNRITMNRMDVMREAQRTLEKLRQDQITNSITELQFDIAVAEREKDEPTIRLLLTVLTGLAAEKRTTAPRTSPVFVDTRTPRVVRKSRFKVVE
ncbi:MAG TPA: DNA primase [Thermomicrobiales bacterium]|nr:DNA primase [Thermomicrobiales bacterium]